MQSGISVSAELQTAFNEFVSSPSQRGLIAIITKESLVPSTSLPSSHADFFDDLSGLQPHLTPSQALYIILRRHTNADDGYVAITYIPDSAPVRSKMLFAATRLTLVRELGTERFREQLFVAEAAELTREGWLKHEASGTLKAPLTAEEQTLEGVKDAEAEARGGTAGRQLETGGKLTMGMTEDALQALEELKAAGAGTVVQMMIDIPTEKINLASKGTTTPEGLGGAISKTEPRYTFFKYAPPSSPSTSSADDVILFIYTCPATSKVKEKMLYAASKRALISTAEKELKIAKTFEFSSPREEVTAGLLEAEFRQAPTSKGPAAGGAFARPKRPGR